MKSNLKHIKTDGKVLYFVYDNRTEIITQPVYTLS